MTQSQPGRKSSTGKPRHRGRFNWRKYTKYSGNLKGYWTANNRTKDRHRADA